jgi:hypothetical protein
VVGKLVCSLALVAAIAALLWFFAFPWADNLLPTNDVTVQGGG